MPGLVMMIVIQRKTAHKFPIGQAQIPNRANRNERYSGWLPEK
ncbi:hypothetical protein DDI_3948 [Dickeya dianthicola RNS04.9]|nr:hypothetical protein DDI_3948 [Dickeya dianthicola RNS04.9]